MTKEENAPQPDDGKETTTTEGMDEMKLPVIIDIPTYVHKALKLPARVTINPSIDIAIPGGVIADAKCEGRLL